MMELFVLGCTGVVVFLHGANFFFHVLSQHLAVRSLSTYSSLMQPVRSESANFSLVNYKFFWGLLDGRAEEEVKTDTQPIVLALEVGCR
ncbi:hypothetical protein CUMW_012220 [Citrus unshiu]|nr:hypothetical protein CUMW_012220 [Citrus unshiu]